MFACCLEDAGYEAAEEAFAALVHTFFDWNEIRVTSLSELSEVLAGLPDPRVAANRIKRILHGVFEAAYSFDLEEKRKKNLGPTVKWLEKLDGTTKFTIAYLVQAALGGHQIPIDSGAMAVLRIVDLVSDKDVAEGVVPGLERAVSKSKGIEFASLLHQLGAEFTANPFSPAVRDILLQIEPTAKDRFPQRRAAAEKKHPLAESVPTPAKKPAEGKSAAEPSPDGGRKKAAAKAHEPAAAEPPTAEAGKRKSSAEGLSKRKPR